MFHASLPAVTRLALNGFTTVSGSERIKRGRGPITQRTVVLNDFSGLGTFEKRSRTTSRGTKDRFSVSIRSEPILHAFDNLPLGRGPAEAIADVLRDKIGGVAATASPSTLLYRRRARDAFERGAKWARKRYAGGRTGAMPPGQTDRLFSDSGRLAKTIAVRENKVEGTWTVNVAANRFSTQTFTEQDLSRMVERLRQFVPELGDARKLATHREVNEAVARSLDQMLRKARMINAQSKQRLRAEISRLFGVGLRGLGL